MRRMVIAALILGFIFSLSGCQPTPDESVIVSKNQNVADTISESTVDQLEEIPPELQVDQVQLSDRLTVKIDADINLPENGVPVARLQRQNIDKEDAERWLSVFADGRECYYLRTLNDLSKNELGEILTVLKNGGTASPRIYLMDGYMPTCQEESIEIIEQYYETASNDEIYRNYEIGDNVLNRTFEFSSEYEVCVASIANGYSAFDYQCYDIMQPQGLVIPADNDTQGGVSISREEAAEIAKEFIENLGFTEFSIDGEGLIPYSDMETGNENSYEDLPKCYIFYFTKEIAGMNETYVDPSYANLFASTESYNIVWDPEYVSVVVSDRGVIAASYPNVPSSVELLEENVEILDFDQIIDRFYEQIKISGCWIDSDEEDIIEKRSVYIDEIVLGGMRVIEKDRNSYLFVPVWSFFGSVVTEYKEGEGDPNQLNENNEFTSRNYRQCVLTLSAIDGSVIDRAQGY